MSECVVNEYLSCVCNRGTKGCSIKHEAAMIKLQPGTVMSEYEEAREQYFSGQRSITNLIQAADAEMTRLNTLLTNSEAGKFIETQRNEITRLKEELAECKEYLEIVQKWGDEV